MPPAPERDPLLRRVGEDFRAWSERLEAVGLVLPRCGAGWPVALVIGARELVLERSAGVIPPQPLCRLLGAWCRSWPYLVAIAKAGAMRHDLDGRPVEPVAAEHRQRARAELERRQLRRRIAEQGAGR